jgi:hypothetical protein
MLPTADPLGLSRAGMSMQRRFAWALGLLLTLNIGLAPATGLRPCTWMTIHYLSKNLHGQVLDFTHNHWGDHRIWSEALCEKRDLYVYLPPCYDPSKQYPAMIYMHGIAQDEVGFLRLVEMIDHAIVCGKLPPLIIAAPDGSIKGRPSLGSVGSFWINSKAGCFENFVVQDVWGFVTKNFSVRPEPECHILVGASMGGFGAFNLGIKYRCHFKTVAGIFPALHLRYLDCHGRYFADYNPCCLGLRERLAPLKPVGRFYGVINIPECMLSSPLYGHCNKDTINQIARENPYEMIDAYDLKPGELAMFAGYGKHDEFNLDAQIEAFVDKARGKGLEITCVCDPNGRHDTATGVRLFPAFCEWLTSRMNEVGK